ncbi:MAG: IS200/IS605 family transposase [Bacteroidales bacterium]|nr:IS200/IS605 family transposase [Bacteroidales bacterium]MCF8405813.1 IS200/IS605 family transposase [Bacteroidales bacterium]
MPNTYSKIYIQLIFAVRNRDALILPDFEEELYKYIAGIIRNQKQKLLAINSTKDHIHIFVGLEPTCRISDLVREIKSDSSKMINEKKLSKFKFNWQEGYGAFSYGASQKQNVINYVMNQKEHHHKSSFRDEYVTFLKKFEVDHDEKYLFDFLDEN